MSLSMWDLHNEGTPFISFELTCLNKVYDMYEQRILICQIN